MCSTHPAQLQGTRLATAGQFAPDILCCDMQIFEILEAAGTLPIIVVLIYLWAAT